MENKDPEHIKYIIKYDDGLYNYGDGFPCQKHEATQYASLEEAEAVINALGHNPVIEKLIIL